MLPQYIVALRVSKNYSKVANLNGQKSDSFFFSSQPSTLMREVKLLKQQSTVKKFPNDGPFVLALKQKNMLYIEYLQ